MIRFVFALALFGSSSVFAAPTPTWSKKIVGDLKTKTLQQTFCQNSPGFQTKAACDYFEKDKKEISKKLISVKAQGNVLTLNDGKRTVEIKRLPDELQFEVNRKLIDIGELRDPGKLAEALKSALPKLAVRSLWMSSAFAQDSANYEAMVQASALILFGSVDESTCGAAASFINSCMQGVSGFKPAQDMAATEQNLKDNIKLHEREADWFVQAQGNVVVLIARMKGLTRGLASRKAALKTCKSEDGKDASHYLDECLESLKKAQLDYRNVTCKRGFERSEACATAEKNIRKTDALADEEMKKIEAESLKGPAVK